MKIDEIVENMSKKYLNRIIDSFTKEFPKTDEEQSRKIILKNAYELSEKKRLCKVLQFSESYNAQLLKQSIIRFIINSSEHRATEQEIIKNIQKEESKIIELAKDDSIFKDKKNIDIFKEVLKIAIEDDKITNEELSLLKKLQERLELSDKTLKILLAKLNNFADKNNKLHEISDYKEALLSLQRRGIVFYCNKLNNGIYVIPEEHVNPIRKYLGIELSENAYKKLLTKLPKLYLSKILSNKDIPKSGSVQQLITRIINANVRPSTALDSLLNNELKKICVKLPGVTSSGTKEERINRIIDYFNKLVVKKIPEGISNEEKYYKYLIELSKRDRETLLANNIISKDIEMANAFELGTKYLFTQKLKLDLKQMDGNDHPDGAIFMKNRPELIMWDNKSTEKIYTFPDSHIRQFKRYIRDSAERVSCFMVIVADAAENVEFKAQRLKVESKKDTDVAIISAENLVWVAENWRTYTKKDYCEPELFNITGILTKQVLEQRMKILL
jgi:hypothetical protein